MKAETHAEKVAAGLSESQKRSLLAAATWAGDSSYILGLRELSRKGLLSLCTITLQGNSRKAAVLTTSGLAVRSILERKQS